MHTWSPTSWQEKKSSQIPHYTDADLLKRTTLQLAKMPPLVNSNEVEILKKYLSHAEKGNIFILQGGDCAETFANCTEHYLTAQLKLLLQMNTILLSCFNKPVLPIGRIAGQYAKPRSSLIECQHGITLPNYQGDIINSIHFDVIARQPDPRRMLAAYHYAAFTMNFIRSFIDNNLTATGKEQHWPIEIAGDDFFIHHLRELAKKFNDAIAKMNTPQRFQLFTSHEALLLPYEQALSRQHPHSKQWYNLSTHFPWIGLRTALSDQAHIEYLRGIANPIGIKVGPCTCYDDLKLIVNMLNPKHEHGKIVLIHRFGESRIEKKLPKLIDNMQALGSPVSYFCDPMHGNNHMTKSKIKTRYFSDITAEIDKALAIHYRHGVPLGGLHLEMTAQPVTECIGGHQEISIDNLLTAYHSYIDPRLNYQQAIELTRYLTGKNRQRFVQSSVVQSGKQHHHID